MMKQKEARRVQLQAALDAQGRLARLNGPEVERLRKDAFAHLGEWRALLKRQPAQARQIIRKLIAGRLVATPTRSEAGKWYDLVGHATLGRVLAMPLKLGATALVAPTGFGRGVEFVLSFEAVAMAA
jgi:hypothetical protein